MKEVITTQIPAETVLAENARDSKFYGVSNKSSRTKGFISRDSLDSGLYRARCSSSLTEGNLWPCQSSSVLSHTVAALAGRECFEVFEFDTAKELFAWLAV